MSATVAFVIIATCILALFAVGAAGWWMTEKTLGGDDEDEHEHEPPTGGSAV
ncbi:hypothetical protein [Haloglomus litoreum]|uniref:hypothetical protein n=1 Tax=Haloglomus litoreum TaxID=3034026 RepID=UPI0023E86659|nr:hypothetical protein [Haloglomus sp. DT116]